MVPSRAPTGRRHRHPQGRQGARAGEIQEPQLVEDDGRSDRRQDRVRHRLQLTTRNTERPPDALPLPSPIRTAVALGLLAFPAAARCDEFRLDPDRLPAPLLDGGKTDTVIEASGVEPIGDGRRFLVAHDKLPGLYVVEAATGR